MIKFKQTQETVTKTMKKCPYYNRGNCQYFHNTECLIDPPDLDQCADMYGINLVTNKTTASNNIEEDGIIEDEVNELADDDNGAIE